MARKATKAADNVFYKARMEAASFNDSFNSREGAAEELGIDRTRLARIELGSLNPYPEEVLLMSDAYNTPELNNYFCSRMCPLGYQTVPAAELLLDNKLFKFYERISHNMRKERRKANERDQRVQQINARAAATANKNKCKAQGGSGN